MICLTISYKKTPRKALAFFPGKDSKDLVKEEWM